jgi:hypothetical protein
VLGSLGDVSFLSFGRGKNITCGSGGAILTNDDRIGKALAREYAQLPGESLLGMLTNWLEVAATQFLINPSRYWFPAGLPFLKLGETKFYTDFPITRMDPVRAGLLLSNCSDHSSRPCGLSRHPAEENQSIFVYLC